MDEYKKMQRLSLIYALKAQLIEVQSEPNPALRDGAAERITSLLTLLEEQQRETRP